LVADPLMAVTDEAPNRVGLPRPETGDHQARQESVGNGKRDYAGIEDAKRHAPFLRQRAHRVVLIFVQQ